MVAVVQVLMAWLQHNEQHAAQHHKDVGDALPHLLLCTATAETK